jgi:hypothetical protein
MKIIVLETGLEERYLQGVLLRLEPKIRYIENYVIIKNFLKYQMTKSDDVKRGILNCLKQVPAGLLKRAIKEGFYIVPAEAMDTLTTAYIEGLQTLSVLKNEKIEDGETLYRPSIDPRIYMDSNKDKDIDMNSNKDTDNDSDLKPTDSFSNEKPKESEIPSKPIWNMTPEERKAYMDKYHPDLKQKDEI